MVRRQKPTVSAELASQEDLRDQTDVSRLGSEGVSPEEAPDSNYTTYEDIESTITAPVRLPPREAIAVQLGPVNLVNRLEEYQSDENLGHMLIGLFVGTALGILSNWVTNPDEGIAPVSVILLVFVLIIAFGVGIWLRRTKQRRSSVKREIDALSR